MSLAYPAERLKALTSLCLGYKDGKKDRKLLQFAKSIWEELYTKKEKRKMCRLMTHCQTICKQTGIELLSLFRKCICLFGWELNQTLQVGYKYGLIGGSEKVLGCELCSSQT